MANEKRKYIGQACYLCLSAKAELFSADGNKHIPLSRTEYKILSFFIDHANTPVYLEELARNIWGVNYEADLKDPDSLKSHISRIRKKLNEVNPELKNRFETNYGYQSYTFKTDLADNLDECLDTAGINKEEIPKNHSFHIASAPNYFITQDINNACVYLYNNEIEEKIRLSGGMILVGRDTRKCDLCLDSKLVSDIHAKLLILDSGIIIEDLHTKNGTFINDVRILPGQKYTLYAKDRIRFANIEFTYVEDINIGSKSEY